MCVCVCVCARAGAGACACVCCLHPRRKVRSYSNAISHSGRWDLYKVNTDRDGIHYPVSPCTWHWQQPCWYFIPLFQCMHKSAIRACTSSTVLTRLFSATKAIVENKKYQTLASKIIHWTAIHVSVTQSSLCPRSVLEQPPVSDRLRDHLFHKSQTQTHSTTVVSQSTQEAILWTSNKRSATYLSRSVDVNCHIYKYICTTDHP